MDDLLDWLREDSVKNALVLDEQPDPALVALVDPTRRCIVTTEVSSPKKRRANRKIPDDDDQFGITSHDVFQFTRGLDFRTDWRTSGV